MSKVFKKIVTNTVTALGGEIEIDYQFLIPAVVNDARVTEIVRSVAVTVVGEENTLLTDSTMGGEDFSYYQKEIPGCYVWLGSRNEEKGIIQNLWSTKKPSRSV
ncbi:M20/M25/M40 family metallo-hydrolase [Bacillus sp. EB600]|uniref:M20/M25/M40 family metallo-hydrolase n=1 Tax=Bacillus sp. EB600 TaxID=2806345 RepID=UPI00210D7AA7|nr:M20/M25/M40 family metallo-hydrolase [Bacillus sp. EB600]MCQ6280268.1 M20/M25/M40 family metallo-hydrolase [Bacillus sp. EB600]